MIPHQGTKEHFVPGQVAVLETADGKSSYIALASAPEDDEYEFLVKDNGSASSIASALFQAGTTAEVALRKIVGQGFAIENYSGRDLVFVAMGTGIAPLRSTLRHVFHRRAEFGQLIVLHGARTNKDFYFEEEILTDWRRHDVTLRQVISQPDEEWSGDTGYVQSLLDNIVPELHNPVALVCGSQEMMQQTKDRLQALGFADEHILTNY